MPRRGLDAEQVVATAAELADAEGPAAVTVARVAAELGVRAPSIYNHVQGRDGLARGVALVGVRELTEAMREAAVGRSGEDALLAAARAYRAYARSHPGRYTAIQHVPASADEEAQAAGADTLAVLEGIVRAWDLTGEDAVHAIRALRSALHGFVDLERVGSFQLAAPLDESFERLVRGFAAGLGRRDG